MEDINKILGSPDRVSLTIASDPKSRTTVIRIEAHGSGTDVIVTAGGAMFTANSAPLNNNSKN